MKKTFSTLALSVLAFIGVSAANAADITVENFAGRQIVSQNPQKVVVLDFGAADTIRALGAADKIVGFPQSGKIPGYLAEFANEKFKNVGDLKEQSLEKINDIAPDLIIASKRQEKMVDKFKEIAPVFFIDNDYKNYYDSFQQNVIALGQIFDKESIAKEKLKALETVVSQVAKDAKDKTALLVLVNESKISAFGDGSRYGMVYQKYGFQPIDPTIKSSTHGQSVGFEYILEKNPDFLLVVDRTAAITEKANNAQKVLDNDIIKQTKAYKNGHIVYLDAANWYLAFGGLESMEIISKELDSAVRK
ncbi:siderophore ABC transporter substrate-binding protein [Rodentibacter haemolyticus]|uniref:ABC transporter substrate-binding protein n=1 Tax=Rodentibacter haemolyticus TaxID=2778911 RepID=A0ABX6UVG9_9PAST|nr:ABC transporter substrate-binding protein [Rodentibacter haemolyticus]QPB42055.1 ABC transporter substrate-binding protein [Rodentibacter haemolyticus]